jgi:hypothetical protein
VSKKLTTEEFIKKAEKIHGNKYDYSKVEYIKSSKNVIIICPMHGDFPQTPNHHISVKSTGLYYGKGCPKCIGRNKTSEEFIKQASEIHKNKYDYSKVEYIKSSKKIIIICPVHGDFTQTPSDHLYRKGCPKCANNINYTTKQFIEKSKEIHDNKYDYSLVEYKNNNINVKIICTLHGVFPQKPSKHLHGQGCKKCSRDKAVETVIKRYGEIYSKLIPSYNPNSIIYLDQISERIGLPIQHALNSGEKKFVRYFIDGYIKEYNICIEWDEPRHNSKKQKEKDLIREQYLIENHGCKFVRINEKELLKDPVNMLNYYVDEIRKLI